MWHSAILRSNTASRSSRWLPPMISPISGASTSIAATLPRLRSPTSKGLHCTHELFRLDGCGVHLDAEWGQGVADGIGDGRRRGDRTAFAHTFDAEGIQR